MRLYTVFKVHKVAGLVLGLILLLLGFTGFFLNHDNFNFLWDVSVSDRVLPQSIVDKKRKAFQAYKINEKNPQHIIAGSRMGLFVSFDGGHSFKKTLSQQVLAITPAISSSLQEDFQTLYSATTNGIYHSEDAGLNWQQIALVNEVVESFSLFEGHLYAVVDKRDVYKINLKSLQTEKLDITPILSRELPQKVTLSRLVRDLHYGRGIFSGNSSLYINDVAAITLTFLGFSGFLIYFMMRRIRMKKKNNKKHFKLWRKLHSNIVVLLVFIPILMLLITGVFLDHSKLFQPFMKKTILNTSYLPPVYKDLKTDIWGFDFDGKYYRMGNRLGVFNSTDLKHWKLDSEGFAYRLKRINDELFISGMGSPNRQLTQQGWKVLKGTPHMPRDVYELDNKTVFYNARNKDLKFPKSTDTPLYYVMLGLHDGELFSGNWVFINDAAAFSGVILLITGFIKWRRRKKQKKSVAC